MTIKKPTKPAAPEPTAAPATGGATIADRFKLDMTEPAPKKAAGGVGAMCAVAAGLLALAVAGILTFVLFQHFQFLANA